MDQHFASAERQILMQSLLAPVLAPLDAAFGPYGEIATEAFAQAVSRAREAGND